MNYKIAFTNNMALTFNCSEDVDLHKLDHTKPISFDNVWINPNNVVFIEKMKEGGENGESDYM